MQLVLPLLLLAASAVTPGLAFKQGGGGNKIEAKYVPNAFIVQMAAPSQLRKRGLEPEQVSCWCC